MERRHEIELQPNRMTSDHEKREFQLWDYKVTHGLMLIRSPGATAKTVNLDIVFSGVEYIEITRFFPDGVQFVDPTQGEIAKVYKILGTRLRPGWAKLYALKSGVNRYLVAASSVQVLENQMDTSESPLELIFQGKPEQLGTTIFRDQSIA